MIGKINEGFGLRDEDFVEKSLRDDETLAQINAFFAADGPDVLLFFYQDGQLFLTDGKSQGLTGLCVYFVRVRVANKPKRELAASEAGDNAISFGTLNGALLDSYESVLAKSLKPLIDAKSSWSQASGKEAREFCVGLGKFTDSVQDQLKSLTSGLELAKPQTALFETALQNTRVPPEVAVHFVDLLSNWCEKVESFLEDEDQTKRDAGEKGPISELEYWRRRTQRLMSITEQLKSKECRTVISVLQSLTKNAQQPRIMSAFTAFGQDFAPSAGGPGAAGGPSGGSGPSVGGNNVHELNMQSVVSLLKRWRQIDINITEAANEAKDNVKYLGTLEKFIEPLYSGTPQTIIDALPALMNSIKMIYTIARYYNTSERMTTLFIKISNQLIINCKRYITRATSASNGTGDAAAQEKKQAVIAAATASFSFKGPVVPATSSLAAAGQSDGDSVERIWDQDPERLLQALEACLQLNEAYQEQYHLTKDKLLAVPKGRQFDFSEIQIFGKIDLFCRRVIKLMDMFSTIHQFNSLASHNLEGMEGLIAQFNRIVHDFRSRQHDLLDFYNNKYDRDYIQFNMRITDLESQLQQFINRSFESITSIEASLTLLKRFQSILQRDTLRADLDAKLTVIFHNYGLDLSTVQELYEKHKHSPPISRNMPPVAGSIIWARHLLRRIEEPMRKFEMNASVLSTKDSKKIIKTYNKVAKTLVAFEYLWYEAWCNAVDAARAGLQATLIIRHPTLKKLFVNFDPEILQLIREAKCLSRLGIEIPNAAKMVLLQEQKFKHYHNELTYLLREYDRVVGMILPVARDMLVPHINDLDLSLRPGMISLTWTSMNIDAYKHTVQANLMRFEELIINMNDIIENRIEKNLKKVGKATLVDLPSGDGLLTLDEFVLKQETFVRLQTRFLDAKNREIEIAVRDLIEHVRNYKLQHTTTQQTVSSSAEADAASADLLDHYNRLMYQALLQATKNSLAAIKKRVCAKGSTGFLYLVRPFFEVDVQLSVPSVRLVPSLDEVQNCINKSAQSILWCSKSIWDWGQLDKDGDDRVSFFERIGKDVQIVRSVLLLTGALLGTKNHVRDYLAQFTVYDWLWKDDMEFMYKRFIDRNPSIDEFEAELSRFVSIESQIRQIPGVHNIGALSLNTNNLKLQLQSEASQWKVQYSDKVHQQASEAMENLLEYIRLTHQRVGREVNSLESLRFVMSVLKEVRERESTIEQEITPILDMYDMLDHYLPPGVVGKEEMDKKGIIRSSWRKLGDFAEEVTDQLAGIQGRFKAQLTRDVKVFSREIVSFRATYLSEGPMVAGLKPKEAVDRLRRFKSDFEVHARKQEILSAGEELFALKQTDYPDLVKTKKELALLDQLYSLYIDVVDTMEKYRNQLWTDCVKTVPAMAERVAEFEARCKRLPVKLRDWDAYKDLRHDLSDFQSVLPLLVELSKPSLKMRHWAQVTHLTGKQFNTETGKLKELWHPAMLNHRDAIEDVCHAADKELEIEDKISSIKEQWAAEHFTFAKWRQRDCLVLKGFSQVIEDLEESQLACQSMLSLRYVAPFKEEVVGILAQLSETGETLELWVKVQTLWMSLESVFTGGDIAKQMPQDAKKFAKIDKDFHKVMERAQDSLGNVLQCCSNELLKNTLPNLYTELERCQKSLEGYLEQKRSRFPRFYFVSNPVLLQILSQGSDLDAVQPFYEKIFDAVSQVSLDPANPRAITHIKNVIGDDEEAVALSTPVQASGHIEDWLLSLLTETQTTMKDHCRAAASECIDAELEDFISRHTAQFALLGLQFKWTAQMTHALTHCKGNKNIMGETSKLQLAILTKLSSMCLTDLGSAMNRKKIETLVTVQVHQRDVSADLFRMFKDRRVGSAQDFDWTKQARFYWNPDPVQGGCSISVCDMDFTYAYEYLGCKERLVITPLTDRCYVSLTQALGMNLGGAPAGPAGTGKTETVKDLGRALGTYVVVINCSDQQRHTDLAKIFKGLCRAGIWGCFDEFNRIELPVLSVVAQQILAITNAKRMQSATLTFPGDADAISIKHTVGTFITMNPGYAGRQELPENLKALFRTVAMMVPDREIIIRVKLCSVGYSKFTELANKFNTLYRCCEMQLSAQHHYDFGLRNILSVLRTAGQIKRDNQSDDEHALLMRALRDMNLSKLVALDVPLFLSLLLDLFPQQQSQQQVLQDEQNGEGGIGPALSLVLREGGLQVHPPWVRKVHQVHDTTLVRHGIIVLGPAGAGKSACLEVLAEAQTRLNGVPTKIVRMNPKAIRAQEMFGETDPASHEWVDGVFATLWAKHNDRSRRDRTWLVCDGPVDALWVENLNTVLDDNKILTLANGERISMSDNVKLVFETEDLENASPATVSRAGIIFVSDSDLDWEPVLESWIAQQQEAHRPILRDLFARWVGNCDLFAAFSRLFVSTLPRTRVSLITSTFQLMEKLIAQAKLSDSPSDAEQELERILLFSLTWTFGALVDAADRSKFDQLLRSVAGETSSEALPARANNDDSCFNYRLALPETSWEPWEEPAWKPRGGESHLSRFRRDFANLRIPTSETLRATFVLKQMHARRKPLLLVGDCGTGKSTLARMFADSMQEEDDQQSRQVFKAIKLSFSTTPRVLQDAIEGEVDKRGGKTYGPSNGQEMTIFLDDLSLPETNLWGDQPTMELVRQLVELRTLAFLDKDKRGDFKTLEDVQFMAAMTRARAGSLQATSAVAEKDKDSAVAAATADSEEAHDAQALRQVGIPRRLLRHFFVLNVSPPNQQTLSGIYLTMIRSFVACAGLQNAEWDLSKLGTMADKLVPATINLWNRARDFLLPTPSKAHYIFTLRDLSRVFQGVMRVPVDVILELGEKTIYKVWRHEVERVFADKLICETDKSRLRSIADEVANRDLGKDVASQCYYASASSGASARSNASASGNRKQSKKEVAQGGKSSAGPKELVQFVDFLRDPVIDEDDGSVVAPAPRVYEPAPSMEALQERVFEFLDLHNQESPERELDLVLFRDALSHLLRAVRVLGLPRGNLLLVGVGGSGKQSIAKLAAYIAQLELFRMNVSKSYSRANLFEDMRALYRVVGKERKSLAFLVSEPDIREESFLEIFNAYLSSGDIVSLFPKDELAVMASDMRSIAIKEQPGFIDTPENLTRYFVDSIRDKLHMILCMSPVHAKYQERVRRFPALFAESFIDWYLPWPTEALQAVADQRLADFELTCSDAVRASLVAHTGSVHALAQEQARAYNSQLQGSIHMTPKSFLSYLEQFKDMYAQRLEELTQKETQIELGLSKLVTGASDVEQLKVVLAQEEVKLRAAEEACNSMISSLEQSSMEAKKEADAVSRIKAACEAEAALITEEKNAAEEDLKAAQPFLEEAEKAANSIKPNDLNELKKLPKPGDIIKLTFDGVMILRMYKLKPVSMAKVNIGIGKEKKEIRFVGDSYTLCQKSMLADSGFLKSLFRFSAEEKDNINDETIELLMPYLDLPDFSPLVARNASKACEGLCAWVLAMAKYHSASKMVKPKLEKLGLAEAKLETALGDLADAESKLQSCKNKLEELQERFQAQMAEKQEIEDGTRQSRARMDKATALIEGLKDERTRWGQDASAFADAKKRLVGDCAVASAFLSYAGAFNQDFRNRLVQTCFVGDLVKRKVPVTLRENVTPGEDETNAKVTAGGAPGTFDLLGFLTDPVTIADFGAQGLPRDSLSVENGVLVMQSARHPLLVDPQGQALQWIRRREAAQLPAFGTTTMQHPRFRDQLESCLAQGKSLVVTGIQSEVDPVLDPVLDKEIVSRGRAHYIVIADKAVDFDVSFALFLITSAPRAGFTPELQARTTVIDFTVTEEGLEDQLLGQVIQKEQRALEDQLTEVLASVTSNTRRLHVLNEELLERLTENSGNLLDDDALVSVLAGTKRAATEVNEKLQTAAETRASILEKREQYRAVATRGTALYFGIVALSALNPMYQTALDQFIVLFRRAMDLAEKNPSIVRRVSAIIKTLTATVHHYVNLGLYKKDKLAFVLFVCLQCLLKSHIVEPAMVDVLLRGAADIDANTAPPKPISWLSQEAYLNALALAQNVPFFGSLMANIVGKESLWRRWWESDSPELGQIPDYESKLASDMTGDFFRLLLVRVLREDRAARAAQAFVAKSEMIESHGHTHPFLGPHFVTSPAESMETALEQTEPHIPVVYLLSPGGDPTEALEALCKRQKQRLTCVSMGAGQGPVALKSLSAAIALGEWVLLQNGHLDIGFMDALQAILEKVKHAVSSDSQAPSGPSVGDNGYVSHAESGAAEERLAVNPKFRLFVTTESRPDFPVGLLQQALKVTNEPPAGIKSSMMRCFTELVDQERLDRVESDVWRKMLFTTCFLHAVVQERRRIGPIGWTIPYQFTVGDLQASLSFVERHLFGASEISWHAIQYMVAEVQLGASVTDDVDRRLMATFADTYLQPASLAPGATLARSPTFTYEVPDFPEIEQYVAAVAAFPEGDDSAEVLGLHANAQVSSRAQTSQTLLDSMLQMQPKHTPAQSTDDASATGQAEMDVATRAAKILSELPTLPAPSACAAHIERLGGLSVPLNVVLSQELAFLQNVLTTVKTSLRELLAALKGHATMTPELAELHDLIFVAKVPSLWEDGWALDGVELSTQITSFADNTHVRAAPKHGVYVHGLVLEGAAWNASDLSLSAPAPKTVSTPMPVIHVSATTRDAAKRSGAEYGPFGPYEAPLYRDTARREFVAYIKLPSKEQRPSHWALRGAALVLS
ncbi:Dynein heavy chain 5, axonemal [Hondaea fermentalgiana]|uniref:Dynein heavy chain 5, axonemal n=1 Tax=Hondaea fermentalgiana TaxID=2315210 RepID=A0A2R5GJM0_9STRA|nr:Dynein heavy chain 5, axonemal [Hondaea fermentalgiana]|eukprot:GBG28853.1 Dynein heavy chain 5, axonemal [Hondaea fermentalgiana]